MASISLAATSSQIITVVIADPETNEYIYIRDRAFLEIVEQTGKKFSPIRGPRPSDNERKWRPQPAAVGYWDGKGKFTAGFGKDDRTPIRGTEDVAKRIVFAVKQEDFDAIAAAIRVHLANLETIRGVVRKTPEDGGKGDGIQGERRTSA